MAEKYGAELLRVAVAQIVQTIGYSTSQTASLELLQDVLYKFIHEFARDLHLQTDHNYLLYPNLNHAYLSLKSLKINIHDILNYIENVEPVPFSREIAVYPVKKTSNMNFLKPGSAETLTRPMHIYEYLPSMQSTEHTTVSGVERNNAPNNEISSGSSVEAEKNITLGYKNKDSSTYHLNLARNVNSQEALHPSTTLNSLPMPFLKNLDVEDRAIREISSVVMTSGGFISPAIEGKLPNAFIPEIIEKCQGLHAPPCSPPDQKLKNLDIDGSTMNSVQALFQQQKTTSNNDSNNDNTVTQINPYTIPDNASNGKTSKKTKKKHFAAAYLNKQTGPVSSTKANEKAQRKALKMYHKLSKSAICQNDSTTPFAAFRKTKKHMNLAEPRESVTERLQLTKLLKKQSKHRQKQIKNQKGIPPPSKSSIDEIPKVNLSQSIECSLNVTIKNEVPKHASSSSIVFSSGDTEGPTTTTTSTMAVSHNILSTIEAHSSLQGRTDYREPIDIKLSNEPDRNKLNIFKKISKQKAIKPFPRNAQTEISTTLFENMPNGHPLINLPSGTTITPANTVTSEDLSQNEGSSNSVAKQNHPDHIDQQFFTPVQDTFGGLDSTTKPKKRGRKPGSKNHPKVSTTPMFTLDSLTRNKHSKITNLSYVSNMQMSHTTPPSLSPIQPLNLDLVEEGKYSTKAITLPYENSTENLKLKSKAKKERKKTKSSALDKQFNANLLESFTAHPIINKKLFALDTVLNRFPPESTFEICKSPQSKKSDIQALTDQSLTDKKPSGSLLAQSDLSPNFRSSEVLKNATLYPNDQTNLLPMLPLLHFSPRPGLIPSGPGIFQTTCLSNSVADSVRPDMLIPPYESLTASTINLGSTINELHDHVPSVKICSDSMKEPKFARNFCHVASLVPDSMKLKTNYISPQVTGQYWFKSENKNYETQKEHKRIAMDKQFALPKSSNVQLRIFRPFDEKLIRQESATGNIGDPIEVSDDSDDFSSLRKEHSTDTTSINLMHTLNNKSSLIQPSSLSCTTFVPSERSCLPTFNNSSVECFNKLKKHTEDANINQIKIMSTPSSSFNLNFIGNDKMSLAGGADLIPLSRVDSGLAYSSMTIPLTSLAAGVTSTSMQLSSAQPGAAEDPHKTHNFIDSSTYDVTITPANSLPVDSLKTIKDHKKLKKSKDGKIKKKKDKKERSRNKDWTSLNKGEGLEKKLKKDKRKDKQALTDFQQLVNPELGLHNPNANCTTLDTASLVGATISEKLSHSADTSTNQVPKITLKLSGKSTPSLFEESNDGNHPITQNKRDQSPELARFSPLVTRPPKNKQSETQSFGLSLSTSGTLCSKSNANNSIKELYVHNTIPTSDNWMSGATLSASSVLLPQQLLQSTKPILSMLLPVPDIDNIANSVPNDETPQSLPLIPEPNRPSSYVDAEGNRIWICPACGKVDDGSAMIGCDGCDAWYHWICVGIFVAPKDNEDWFCRVCITKKKVHGTEKKKKRTKKK